MTVYARKGFTVRRECECADVIFMSFIAFIGCEMIANREFPQMNVTACVCPEALR